MLLTLVSCQSRHHEPALTKDAAFERSPSKDPSPKGGACDQPPTTTFIKCVFWGGPVTAANAVNSGQYRNE